jgi:hypothetical protein
LKNKKYFFVISCFFLTQVDKLLNTPRITSAHHSFSVLTPNNDQVLVEISSGGSCKSQCSVWSRKSEEIHFVTDTTDLKMVMSH